MKNKILSIFIYIFFFIIFLFLLDYLLPFSRSLPSGVSFSPENAKQNKALICEYKTIKIKGRIDYEIGDIWLEYKVWYEGNGHRSKLIEMNKNKKTFVMELKYLGNKENYSLNNYPIICFKGQISSSYRGNLVIINNFKIDDTKNIEIQITDEKCQNVKATLFLSPKNDN